MFIKNSNLLFLMVLLVSTLLIISSNSWVTIWILLEINLMALIPILAYPMTAKNISSTIKYFLLQALASIILFIGVCLLMSKNYLFNMNYQNDLITVALAMKMGLPPFHLWVSQVIDSINMIKIAMVLISQKIAPMIIMSYSINPILLTMIIISALLGGVGGLNSNNLKTILFYSSLAHLSWMMLSIMISESVWAIYFTTYSLVLIPLMSLFNNEKNLLVSNLALNKLKVSKKILIISSVFSLGGVPPFIGFMAKVVVIKSLIMSWAILMSPFLITSSLLSIYYYFKMTWMILINKSSNNKTDYFISQKYFSSLIFSAVMSIMMFSFIIMLI